MNKQQEVLKLALKKAFDLGKRYWQQANSDFTSQWRKSDVTLASFNQLVEDTIREALAEQPAKEKAPQSANCEAPGWINSDHARRDDCTTRQPAQQQEPTVEDNSQEWRGMDGTTAYWLIQRHADGWPDIGKMMGEWLEANQTQPAQQPTNCRHCGGADNVICAGQCKEQPAQQQEPVAWLSRDDARLALWDAINKREFGNPTDDKLILDHLRKNGLWIGKYTSPPASKPWVGLTDVEWMNIVNKDHAWFGQRPEEVAHEVAKLVEAKLREKNNG